MSEFFKNFFDNGYHDNLGEGTFGHRHLVWVLATLVCIFALYFLFKKHKRAGLIFICTVSAAIFLFRTAITVHRLIIKLYDPPLSALPWHMCSLLAFLLPVVIIFDLKKFKTAIYSASVAGGVITLALGDYFDHALITIYLWESMITHSMMIIMPLIEIAIGRFKIELKNLWQAVAGVLFFMAWATLANEVIFRGHGFNYMYLKNNALPLEIPGIHYFVLYVVMYIIYLSIFFGAPLLHRRIKAKRSSEGGQALPAAANAGME